MRASPDGAPLSGRSTCAGLFALPFCQQRGIDTADLGVTLTATKSPEGNRVAEVGIDIELPPGFPEKYRDAIVRAVDQCTAKRHVLAPPAFVVTAAAAGMPETVQA